MDDQQKTINSSYLDNLLRAGAEEWRTQVSATIEIFETTRSEKTTIHASKNTHHRS